MKLKKLSSVFLSVIMLLAFAVPFSVFAEDTEVSEPKPVTDPEPYLYSIGTTVFQAGDVSIVPMTISTRADGYVYNLRMKIKGPEGKEDMFKFYNSTGWLEIDDVSDKTVIKPYVQISPSLVDGTYPVSFIFEYNYGTKKGEQKSTTNLTIHGRSNSALYVKNATFSKEEIGKDNKSELTVNVMNPTGTEIKDIEVSLNTTESKGFSLYNNSRNMTIPIIKPSKTGAVKFSTYVDSTIATGNYPLTIDMSYEDATGTMITSSEVVYVQVNRTADAGTDNKGSTPRIIVSKYTTDVKEIKAGKSFLLDFTLKNTSSSIDVSNIKVVVGSVTTSGTNNQTSTAVFFPSEGSNSFFIDKMTSLQTKDNQIKLMTSQDIEPGVYPVLLKLDYEDASGNPISSEEQISFAVTQEQRLDVQAMSVPADAMMGSSIPINFQYINKGKSTIYNLSVCVEGDFTLEGGSQYIGNLTAGYNDYFDNVIMPTKEGELKGELVLNFENSNGDELDQRFPITCNVAPMMQHKGEDMPGMSHGMEPMPQEPKSGVMSKILWIGIPTLILAIGVVAFIIIRKKRKARKEMVEDEED